MLIFKAIKNFRNLSVQSTSVLPKLNSFKFISNELDSNTVNEFNKNLVTYKCPSIKSFQLPLIDIQIIDILKRQHLNLPEVNKNKEVIDPLLIFQIEQKLPESSKKIRPMQCNQSLHSEVKWRRRKMNKKKKKKYLKKMFYVIQRRKQAKEKRYQTILNMFQKIHEKKVENFDPYKMINRELEKAKFYGYTTTNLYDQYRELINRNLVSFDEKYFRKFEDPKLPIHLKYSGDLSDIIRVKVKKEAPKAAGKKGK